MPARLFERPASTLLGVSPDGREFVMSGEAAQQLPGASELIVIQHWAEELTRLVPVR